MRFKKLIGFSLKDKHDKIKNMNNTDGVFNYERGDKINLYPSKYITKYLNTKFNLKIITSKKFISLSTILKIAKKTKGIKTREIRRDLIKKDFSFDIVKNINSIKKEEFVYDLSLPDHYENFIAGNGAIICHNSYYAGALGLGFMNVFYAPYLKGMSYEEIKQQVQYLWYSGSQNAFSRGGQSLFLDYGLTYEIPDYFKDTDAIGPGGKVVGKYKDFENEAQLFTQAVLEVTTKGDKYGRPFAFPKANINITERSFEDKRQKELFEMTCEAASINGSPYFVMNRDKGESLSQCCFEGHELITYIDKDNVKHTKIIEDYVKVFHEKGNKIESYNFEENKSEIVEITGILEKENNYNELIEFETEDGIILKVTPDHIFMVRDVDEDKLKEVNAIEIFDNYNKYEFLC